MFFFGIGVYEDVINKHHDELVKILHGCMTDGISHEKLTFRMVQVSSTRYGRAPLYFYFQYIYDARLLF
jgi:hypothetical protein